MHDLSKIKSTVAHDPLPFLTTLYGDTVKRSGNDWRVGSKGGRSFDTRKGELLCVTFNGDAGQGDCFEVWKSITIATSPPPSSKSRISTDSTPEIQPRPPCKSRGRPARTPRLGSRSRPKRGR